MATSTKAKAATEDTGVNANVKTVTESVYTAEELAKNHNAFKTSYEIVKVALRKAGKATATVAEAKTIIEKFKNKEVK